MVSHIPSSTHYGTYNSTIQNSNMHVGYGCSNIDMHLEGCDWLLRPMILVIQVYVSQ